MFQYRRYNRTLHPTPSPSKAATTPAFTASALRKPQVLFTVNIKKRAAFADSNLKSNGVKYFNLNSVYIGCVIAAGVGTPVGSANAPTDCTVQAVGTTLNGSMVSVDLIFTASLNQALFTFPSSFSSLTTVNFVLTSTSATTGLATVDFDNVAYTVSTC